jgi:hypothetical protein
MAGGRPKQHGAAETAAPRKRAVAPPFGLGGKFELRFGACTYFAVVSPCIRARRMSDVRNCCVTRPMQNDALRTRRGTHVQDEAVGVSSEPTQIAQVVVAEPDHLATLPPRIRQPKSRQSGIGAAAAILGNYTDLICSPFRALRPLGSGKIAQNFALNDRLQNFAGFSHCHGG